jgi:hypothetical protein
VLRSGSRGTEIKLPPGAEVTYELRLRILPDFIEDLKKLYRIKVMVASIHVRKYRTHVKEGNFKVPHKLSVIKKVHRPQSLSWSRSRNSDLRFAGAERNINGSATLHLRIFELIEGVG